MGAEAIIESSQFLSYPTLCKRRVVKRYRVSLLDERINKQRLLQEARCLTRCYIHDIRNKSLFIEELQGEMLKITLEHQDLEKRTDLMEQLGIQVAKMHAAGVVHGDLTSSNVIVSLGKVYLIDFGLSQMKGTIEDKAVDLYVLEKALSSTHSAQVGLFDTFLTFYATFPNTREVITRYHTVRARGRKRSMIG